MWEAEPEAEGPRDTPNGEGLGILEADVAAARAFEVGVLVMSMNGVPAADALLLLLAHGEECALQGNGSSAIRIYL